MSNCKSCGAEVTWVKTEGGARMPLEAEPSDHGNVVIVGGLAHVLTKRDGVPDAPRYLSHFASCPDADRNRARGEATEELWDEERCREWIGQVKWVFAKSVPGQPHEYHYRTPGDDGYDAVRAVILSRGVKRRWQNGRIYAYWPLDGWEYWATPNYMLNRRRIEWEDEPI